MLNSYKLKIENNFTINRVSDLHVGLGYASEEYSLNKFRNKYTVELGYKFRLK